MIYTTCACSEASTLVNLWNAVTKVQITSIMLHDGINAYLMLSRYWSLNWSDRQDRNECPNQPSRLHQGRQSLRACLQMTPLAVYASQYKWLIALCSHGQWRLVHLSTASYQAVLLSQREAWRDDTCCMMPGAILRGVVLTYNWLLHVKLLNHKVSPQIQAVQLEKPKFYGVKLVP